MPQRTIPASGRYPGATAKPSLNFWEGNKGRKAVVLHIAQGGYQSSIDYMAAHGTSSHFMISRGGSVAQLVSLDDSAWANGLTWDATPGRWVCPHDNIVVPSWELLDDGDDNPNWTTISVEHEGYSGKPQPIAQRTALLTLLEYLAGRYLQLAPYIVGRTLIGHRHIDPTDKSFCPGSGIDLQRIADEVNRRLSVNTSRPLLWMQSWAARGVPLPVEQIPWAIPQLYKFHFAELGACIRPEEWLLEDQFSIALFERGFIYYVKKSDRAGYSLFPVPIVA